MQDHLLKVRGTRGGRFAVPAGEVLAVSERERLTVFEKGKLAVPEGRRLAVFEKRELAVPEDFEKKRGNSGCSQRSDGNPSKDNYSDNCAQDNAGHDMRLPGKK